MVTALKKIKRRMDQWGFQFRLLQKIHDISQYWKNGHIEKTEVPQKAEVLVLSPHPDDESIGCGGTLRLLMENGSNVDVAYMTNGERGRPDALANEISDSDFANLRMAEAREACQLLGTNGPIFLNGKDGHLSDDQTLVNQLAELLNGKRYDIIFCPWPYDSHSDHEATFRILQSSANLLVHPLKQVWLYEVWSPLHANRVVNIDRSISWKIRALKCYRSQIEQNDYPGKITALARYRSIHLPDANFAEAFLTVSGEELNLLP